MRLVELLWTIHAGNCVVHQLFCFLAIKNYLCILLIYTQAFYRNKKLGIWDDNWSDNWTIWDCNGEAFLKTGLTLAVRQPSVSVAVSVDFWKIITKRRATPIEYLLRNAFGMSSGPGKFFYCLMQDKLSNAFNRYNNTIVFIVLEYFSK